MEAGRKIVATALRVEEHDLHVVDLGRATAIDGVLDL
jgi:hypothetical protein